MQKPILVPIEPSYGAPATLVFLGGSIVASTVPQEQASQWWWLVRALGWQGAIAQLEWDPALNLSLEELAQAGDDAPALWNHARKQYKRIGKSFLPKLLWSAEISQVSFLAIAQGSQVAYYALREWVERQIQVQDVILLAGLVKRDRSQGWPRIAQTVQGRLFNHYNSNDLLLHRFCQVLGWQRSACGVKPITASSDRLLNLDASPWLTTAFYSAQSYQPVLEEWVQPYWQGEDIEL
ncbi:MAG: DUF726 domain-containing protein [Cyanobacteria bacterium P01_G01_bin.54]